MTDYETSNEYYKSDTIKQNIPKCSFEQKKVGKDGLVLQLHHTLPEPGGKVRTYRFISASFDITGEKLAVCDSTGNAFIIDLLSYKFWMLPKLPPCNFLIFSRFSPKKQDVLVGCISGPLLFINTGSGDVTAELSGHKTSPQSASFAEDEPFCLTMGSDSAVIWDLRSCSLMHQLTLRSSISIKQVKFMPVTNNILGLFEDNSVHVWKFETLECTKQIFPEEWGGPNIRAIAFTRNGRGMVMGGLSSALAVFLLDDWTLQKLIALPDNYKGVRQLVFIPQLFDGGANKILAVLSISCSLIFVDTETSVLLRTLSQLEGCVGKVEASLSGKYAVAVMHGGEVNIYSSSQLLVCSLSQLGKWKEPLVSDAGESHPLSYAISRTAIGLSKEVISTIDITRLRPILKEFGEYPQNHRCLIWRTILNLPENQTAYVALISKDIHQAFAALDKVFPLSDKSLSSSIKRLLSCLAYWSPVFLQVKYLPIFVLPFVKLVRHNQFACFETVATILVNWCQGWFQFVPFPALTVMDSIRQLLSVHDSQLTEHLTSCGVTADLYIWSLLETAFYEVLGWSEWQQLWDHILSNHPAFLLFTVVAFNTTCRCTLLNMRELDDFQHFFHTEVVVNMKQLIGKSYQLWSNTSEDIHPKRNMKPFQPLVKGSMYQMFTDYPKHLLDNQLDKLSNLYEDHVILENQQKEVNKQKREVDAEMLERERFLDRQARLRELEEAYKHALKREENRLDNQRRQVSTAWRDLRQKEVSVRSQVVDKALQEKAEKYARLEHLFEQIESKNRSLAHQAGSGIGSSVASSNPSSLRFQHASAVHHLSKLKKLYLNENMAHPQLRVCINRFEDLLKRLECALDHKQVSGQERLCYTNKIPELEDETKALEDEAQDLLRKLTMDVGHQPLHCSQCSQHKYEGSKLVQTNKACYICGERKKL